MESNDAADSSESFAGQLLEFPDSEMNFELPIETMQQLYQLFGTQLQETGVETVDSSVQIEEIRELQVPVATAEDQLEAVVTLDPLIDNNEEIKETRVEMISQRKRLSTSALKKINVMFMEENSVKHVFLQPQKDFPVNVIFLEPDEPFPTNQITTIKLGRSIQQSKLYSITAVDVDSSGPPEAPTPTSSSLRPPRPNMEPSTSAGVPAVTRNWYARPRPKFSSSSDEDDIPPSSTMPPPVKRLRRSRDPKTSSSKSTGQRPSKAYSMPSLYDSEN